MESPFLLYHKIDRPTPDVKVRGAYTSPHRFERQLSYLKRNAFRFMNASQMIDHYRSEGRFPDRTLCLTFDDGWKDNFTHAFPVLQKFGIPATIFLVVTCLGERSTKVAAEGEGPREHMSTDNIREMARAGIEFGSHTMNHLLFNRSTEQEIENEVGESKKWIENMLQKECRVFAYPAGFHTEFARDAVRRAGYIAAFSTVYGDNDHQDLFALNRTEILRRHRYPFRFPKRIRSIFAD